MSHADSAAQAHGQKISRDCGLIESVNGRVRTPPGMRTDAKASTDTIVQYPRVLSLHLNDMPSNKTELANNSRLVASNPLDVVPDEMPFDVPYGLPISLAQAQAVIHAAVVEATQRNWKMNVAVSDSGGNLVAFQRMDGAMLASIQIAEHKARAAVTFRRPTKIFEDGIQLMHLNYLLAFDGVIASRGGIPLIDKGTIIGAIGCSGGTDSQDEIVSKAGAALINQVPATIK